MALPPLPEHNTPRLFLDYEGNYGKRSAQFRIAVGADPNDAMQSIANLVQTLKPIIFSDTTFTGVRYAAAGSNVSNPLGWAPTTGTATGTLATTDYPRFFAFWGRSQDGREVRLTFYGSNLGVTPDYRVTGGENSTIAAAILQLNTDTMFRTISGALPRWKQYANTGYNAYHQRRRRVTA